MHCECELLVLTGAPWGRNPYSFLLRDAKLRYREVKQLPQTTQLISGRAGIWTKEVLWQSYCSQPVHSTSCLGLQRGVDMTAGLASASSVALHGAFFSLGLSNWFSVCIASIILHRPYDVVGHSACGLGPEWQKGGEYWVTYETLFNSCRRNRGSVLWWIKEIK